MPVGRSFSFQRIACRMADAGSPPTEVVLCPAGWCENGQGGLLMDDEGARQAIRAFNRHGVHLPIDFEHQTLGGVFAAPNGRAPAAGWITELVWRPLRGLCGKVSWCKDGADSLALRRYRYISPVVHFDVETRRVFRIHSAGLTNKPAIEHIPAMVNRDPSLIGANAMEFKSKVAVALALPETSSEEEILKAIDALVTASTSAESANSASQLDRRDYETAVNRASNAEKELHEVKRGKFIERGAAEGKIHPLKKDWWGKLYDNDPATAESFLSGAPIASPPAGRMVNTERTGSGPVSRQVSINSSLEEFRSKPDLARITDAKSYVNGALVQKGMKVLSEDEVARLLAV